MKRSGQHTGSVVRACRRWNRDNRPIMDMLRSGTVPPGTMIVRFEDLVSDYDRMLERIFTFLDLEPVSREDVNRDGRPVFFSRSRFGINTVRGGLDPDPAVTGSWRGVLTESEILRIESECAGGMALMGYETSSGESGRARRNLFPQGLRDVAIPFRYALRWPEYLFFTALRSVLLRFFALWYPRGRRVTS
jgi:hypothetical protein